MGQDLNLRIIGFAIRAIKPLWYPRLKQVVSLLFTAKSESILFAENNLGAKGWIRTTDLDAR